MASFGDRAWQIRVKQTTDGGWVALAGEPLAKEVAARVAAVTCFTQVAEMRLGDGSSVGRVYGVELCEVVYVETLSGEGAWRPAADLSMAYPAASEG